MSYYMPIEGVDLVSQIETRICKLQEDHISLQEKFKEDQNSVGRNLDDSALRMIEILELIDMSKSNMDLGSEGPLIINKIVKRISDILKRWQVQEIICIDGKIEPGKARVLETRISPNMPSGTIIEVCRKGYSRGGKVIRPADVITTGG